MSHLFKGRSDGCNDDESPRGTSKNISTHKSRVTQSRCQIATSRFARVVHNELRFRVPREGGREKDREREREARANSLSLTLAGRRGQMSEPVLKISKGRPFSGTGEAL